jgi:hypothetical protein
LGIAILGAAQFAALFFCLLVAKENLLSANFRLYRDYWLVAICKSHAMM